jgi:hypothetical protein
MQIMWEGSWHSGQMHGSPRARIDFGGQGCLHGQT